MPAHHYSLIVTVTLTVDNLKDAEQASFALYDTIWDAMPEHPKPDSTIILLDRGQPVYKVDRKGATRLLL